jgi:hypothetical protein
MHFQHDRPRSIFQGTDFNRGQDQMMPDVGSDRGNRRIPIHALAAWILATLLVAMATLGPPLTGQSIHAIVELRHDVLTIDREFERSSIRANNTFLQSGALAPDDLRRKSGSTELGMAAGRSVS